jgi:hypothetical protein
MRKTRVEPPLTTDATAARERKPLHMHARAVEDAGTRLRQLQHEEVQDLALAGVAIASALAATQRAPSLALPLFVGGLALGMLGIRALWRHWDLVDRLAAEPDAYTLAEVFTYASRETTMDRRRAFAARIRHALEGAEEGRLGDAAAELAALTDELEDETLELSPSCAVVCARLLGEPAQSALLNPVLRDQLRSTTLRIRAGLAPRR